MRMRASGVVAMSGPWDDRGRAGRARPSRRRHAAQLLGWLAVLAAALWWLHRAGGGALAPPALTDPAAVWAWAEARAPLVVVAAGARVLLVGLGWYLLGTTVVAVAARGLRAVRLAALADAVTLPPVRRLVHGALGVGLAATVVAAPAVPAAGAPPAAPAPLGAAVEADDAVDERTDPREARTGPTRVWPHATAVDAPRPAPPWLPAAHPDRLPADARAATEPGGGSARAAGDGAAGDGAAESRAAEGRAAEHRAAENGPRGDRGGVPYGPGAARAAGGDGSGAMAPTQEAATVSGPAPARTWEIAPGDHLWGVAEATLAEAWERVPHAGEVAAYLERLVEANRDALPDPDNPDLVLPGLEVTLPDADGVEGR